GTYFCIENYCTEKNCDCRKVMINIIYEKDPDITLATISYGWESLKYYKKWAYGSKFLAKQVHGLHVELAGHQSNFTQFFIDKLRDITERSDKFANTFKNHYELFKNKAESIDDKDFCLCGSEKSYKQCCG
ncbi:hypothetical protein KKB40_02795, partial [Patescibacteria group bacterium]|nr:hypothetical protein [Patescibacteria group bacterium]